ncbi:MAG: extracellular solute-binding protein [Roseiflexaceae bacterium]|nr:extracellular solute-binding protein [Roseiflexaceae bacterium]
MSTTITFGALQEHRAVYEPLIEAFNAQQLEMQVRFVALDDVRRTTEGQERREQLRAIAEAADTAYPFTNGAVADEAALFQDLLPLINADQGFDQNDYLPGALQSTSDQALYALPRTISVPVLSYNKTLWDERGLPPPSPDWAWNQMRVAALRLTERSYGQITTYGMIDQGDGLLFMSGELLRNDSSITQRSAADIRIDAPWNRTVLSEMPALVSDGTVYIDRNRASNLNSLSQVIRSGKVGMWPTGLLPLPADVPFEIGTAAYPVMPLPFFSSRDQYVISRGTAYPELAWRWLAFLSKQVTAPTEAALDFTLTVPARRSVAVQSGYWDAIGPEVAAAVEATLARPAAPSSTLATTVWWLREPLHQVVFEGEAIADALAQAQTAYETWQNDQQTAQGVTPDAPLIVATAAPDTSPGVTQIVFATEQFNSDALRQQAELFQRQRPDISVEITAQGGQFSVVDLAATADCFGLAGPPATSGAELLDLQPLLDGDARQPAADIPPALLALYRQQGRLVALPHAVSFRVMAYNRELFDAAGLNYPTENWTLDTLVGSARQLQQEIGGQGYGFALHGGVSNGVLTFLDLADAQAVAMRDQQITLQFTQPEVLAAIQRYVELLQTSSPHQQLSGYANSPNESTIVQQLQNGEIALWFDTTAGLPIQQVGQQIGLAPLPLKNNALLPRTIGANGLAIAADTPHPQACWDWITFLNERPPSVPGAFPARQSLSESQEFQATVAPDAVAVYNTYLMALDQPPVQSDNWELQSFETPLDPFWFFRAVDRALQGGDLERELAEAQRLTEQFLDCTRGGTPGPDCAVQVDPKYQGWKNATLPAFSR